MNGYRRVTVHFDRDGWQRLSEVASREYRRPRDQVTLIIHQALGLADKPPNGEKYNGAGVRQDKTGAAVLQA
jgi:hypothetical protein